jgi:hypothetical protein
MMSDDDLNARIEKRAYQMWIDEGQPEGKANSHWELARLAISFEDAKGEMTRPVTDESDKAEPIESWVNQAEFPTLTDQGEQMAPGEMADPNK